MNSKSIIMVGATVATNILSKDVVNYILYCKNYILYCIILYCIVLYCNDSGLCWNECHELILSCKQDVKEDYKLLYAKKDN